MREFISESSVSLYFMVGYLTMMTLLFIQTIRNTKKKLSRANFQSMVFGWNKVNVGALHLFWPILAFGLFRTVYVADAGWFLDAFAWLCAVIGLLLPLGIFNIQSVTLAENGIEIIPAFTELEEYTFDSIELLEIIKEKRTVKSIVSYVFELKFYTNNKSFEISENTNNMYELIEILKSKIDQSKIKLIDKTND